MAPNMPQEEHSLNSIRKDASLQERGNAPTGMRFLPPTLHLCLQALFLESPNLGEGLSDRV